MRLTILQVSDGTEIERAVQNFAQEPHGGLVVQADPVTNIHRELIISLAPQHRLPAVYKYRYFVMEGGLISYGIDPADSYRQAASYVHRILMGEKPADMPVQQADQVRASDQSKDRQNDRSHRPTDPARPRRRGYRVTRRAFITLIGAAAAWRER